MATGKVIALLHKQACGVARHASGTIHRLLSEDLFGIAVALVYLLRLEDSLTPKVEAVRSSYRFHNERKTIHDP